MSASIVHGSWDCQRLLEQKIVLQKSKGSWNVNAANGYAKDLLSCADSLSTQPWASLSYEVDWELGVPEIEKVVCQLFQKIARMNCQINVVVVENSVAKFQLEKMLKVDDDNYQLIFTNCISEAIEVLVTNGFMLDFATFDQFLKRPY